MRMLTTRFGFPHHLLRDNEGISFSHVCVNRFILTSLLRVRSRPCRGSVCFPLLFTSASRMTTGGRGHRFYPPDSLTNRILSRARPDRYNPDAHIVFPPWRAS
mgnify:CR=1 FL=1